MSGEEEVIIILRLQSSLTTVCNLKITTKVKLERCISIINLNKQKNFSFPYIYLHALFSLHKKITLSPEEKKDIPCHKKLSVTLLMVLAQFLFVLDTLSVGIFLNYSHSSEYLTFLKRFYG